MNTLELNWLARGNKQLSLPGLVFTSLDDAAGLYIPPDGEHRIIFDGKDYSLSHGLIAIDTTYNPEAIPSILAHEWRHHWQTHSGWTFEPTPLWTGGTEEEYKQFFKLYFTSTRHELDALLFQIKMTDRRCTESVRDALELLDSRRSYIDMNRSNRLHIESIR